MNLIWFFGLVYLSASVTGSQDEDLIDDLKRDYPRKLCGKNLSEALAIVCRGRYNGWQGNKRSPMNEMFNDDYVYEQQPSEEYLWPFLSRESALLDIGPVSTKHRRIRRGIVEECCKNSCSLKQLKMYCAV